MLSNLKGWRLGAFGLLGAYVAGTTVFLVLGGAAPTETSMVTMEDTVLLDALSDSDERAGCDEIDPTVVPEGATELGFAYQYSFETLDGRQAHLAAYAGCPLLVNFFAKWCGPCVREMPEFDSFNNTYGSQVALVGWAIDGLEPAQEIVDQTGVTYLAGAGDSEGHLIFGGLAMPTTAFVDAAGNVCEAFSGALDEASLADRVEQNFGIDLDVPWNDSGNGSGDAAGGNSPVLCADGAS